MQVRYKTFKRLLENSSLFLFDDNNRDNGIFCKPCLGEYNPTIYGTL